MRSSVFPIRLTYRRRTVRRRNSSQFVTMNSREALAMNLPPLRMFIMYLWLYVMLVFSRIRFLRTGRLTPRFGYTMISTFVFADESLMSEILSCSSPGTFFLPSSRSRHRAVISSTIFPVVSFGGISLMIRTSLPPFLPSSMTPRTRMTPWPLS